MMIGVVVASYFWAAFCRHHTQKRTFRCPSEFSVLALNEARKIVYEIENFNFHPQIDDISRKLHYLHDSPVLCVSFESSSMILTLSESVNLW